jgi:hypothetical protein
MISGRGSIAAPKALTTSENLAEDLIQHVGARLAGRRYLVPYDRPAGDRGARQPKFARMFERRREIRARANLRGAIKFGAAGKELPCTVLDLTPRGAGLSVGTTFGVPQVFQLMVDGEKASRHCRVVWTDDKKLGVSFE